MTEPNGPPALGILRRVAPDCMRLVFVCKACGAEHVTTNGADVAKYTATGRWLAMHAHGSDLGVILSEAKVRATLGHISVDVQIETIGDGGSAFAVDSGAKIDT